MKFSENTLAILNNFKNLNKTILFYPGREIKNMSTDTSVYMTATIEEEIPLKFAVFSLAELLQSIMAIKDGELTFKEDHLLISNGTDAITFQYAKAIIIDDVYKRKITLGDPSFSFKLANEQVKNLFKVAGFLGMYDVKVIPGDQGTLVLYDAKGTHEHRYAIKTGVPIDIEPISFNISALSLLDMGYNLSYFPNRNIMRFSGDSFDVKYHVTCKRPQN